MLRATVLLLAPACWGLPSPLYFTHDGQTEIALCAIDVSQATFKIGQAGNALNAAVKACKRPVFTDTRRALCAATTSDVISSFLDAATFVALAASDCAATVNVQAFCSADVTGLVSSLAMLADAGASVSNVCTGKILTGPASLYNRRLEGEGAEDGPAHATELAAEQVQGDGRALRQQEDAEEGKEAQEERGRGDDGREEGSVWEPVRPEAHGNGDEVPPVPPVPRELQPGSPAELAQVAALAHIRHEVVQERKAEISECVFDVGQAALFLTRAGMAINAAVKHCHSFNYYVHGRDAYLSCGVDVSGVVASFANVAEFISFAAAHCPLGRHVKALCAADISKLLAAFGQFSAAAFGLEQTCGRHQLPPSHDPLSRRLTDANSTGPGGVLV